MKPQVWLSWSVSLPGSVNGEDYEVRLIVFPKFLGQVWSSMLVLGRKVGDCLRFLRHKNV